MPRKTNPAFFENPPRIFLSYSRKDGEDFACELRGKLEAHELSAWQDRIKIEGAKKWWAQIEGAIKTVEYMVLVVTKGALKSRIVQREWKFARQEGKGVIPVIGSKDLDFDNMPRWMKAEHFVDTTHPDQWRRFLRTLEGPHQSIHIKYVEEKLPDNFVDRPREFEPLLKELVGPERGEAVAITATLQGAGGFGKTTLARALCHHPTTKDTYFDGIHWVTIGETPGDLTGRVLDLIERISGQRPGFETLEGASDRLAELLANHPMLLVIDDVWDSTHLKPFLKGGSNCTRLITTRNQEVIPTNTRSVIVDRMDTDEAVALLKRGLPDGQEERLPALAKRLGHWPLLLNLVASALRKECERGESVSGAIAYIEEGLREEGLTAFDVNNVEDRNLAVEATINVSLRRLAESSRERFQELSIFPEDTKIPIRVVEVYWEATGGLTSFQVNKTIREIFGFSLLWALNLEEQYLQLHDVFRGYLRSKKKNELQTLQNRFLDTWNGNKAWHTLSKTEPYIWHHLAWHLIEAGRREELERILLDFSWLHTKLETTDLAALLKDFDYVKNNDVVEKVRGAIRLSAHTLGQDTTQLLGQLVGRLKAVQQSEIQSFLNDFQEYADHPWLRPLQGNLIAPGGPLIHTLSGHGDPVQGVKVTPDGTRGISVSLHGTCKVWDLVTGQKLFTLCGDSGRVRAVTVSSDGTRAISVSLYGTCKVWDLRTGEKVHTLRGANGRVRAVAATPDGTRVISSSEDGTCEVWDLATGEELFTLADHGGLVQAVTVTSDGTRAVLASEDSTCKVWDLRTGEEVHTLRGHSGSVRAVAVTPNGTRAISASEDGTCKLWDLAMGQELFTLRGHDSAVEVVTVTPDGTQAISASEDGICKVWDLATGQELFTLRGHGGSVEAVTVAPDGTRAVTASKDGTCKVWDLRSGREVHTLLWFPKNGDGDEIVLGVTVMPDTTRAITSHINGNCKVWSLTGENVPHILTGHTKGVMGMAMTPRGMWAVSASKDATCKVWDLRTGEEVHTLRGHSGSVRAVAMTPDGMRAISASEDGTCKLWDLRTGKEVYTLCGIGYWEEQSTLFRFFIISMALTPDGTRAVTASEDGTCKVWDLSTGEALHTLRGHSNRVRAVAVTPDGTRAISASVDETCKVWDLAMGQELFTLRGHDSAVEAVTVTPDGTRAVTASEDGTCKVWDLATGQETHTFRNYSNIDGREWLRLNATEPYSLVLTPNGKRAVFVTGNEMCKVLDLINYFELATFTGESLIVCCAVSFDGRTIVVGERSGRVHILRLEGID